VSDHGVNDDPVEEPGSDTFDEVREAAGAVISSLKRLIDATERVVQDPAAFTEAVDGGRSIVEAFVGGFTSQANPDDDGSSHGAANSTAESDGLGDES
jgi:hypothetical protein